MILLIKRKGDYYRRFKLDIWGLSYVTNKHNEDDYWRSWYIRFFFKIYKIWVELWWKKRRRYIYRIDIIDIKEKKKKYSKRWLSLRLTRLYFLTLQDHQFRKMFMKASKMSGDLGSNYCHLLECRLLPLYYRSNFTPDLFSSLRFIKNRRVFVNYELLSYINAVIPIGSFMTPKIKWRKILRYYLILRVKLRALLFNTPRFLYISFRFCYVSLNKKPKKKDLVYPINIDIQRVTGYY